MAPRSQSSLYYSLWTVGPCPILRGLPKLTCLHLIIRQNTGHAVALSEGGFTPDGAAWLRDLLQIAQQAVTEEDDEEPQMLEDTVAFATKVSLNLKPKPWWSATCSPQPWPMNIKYYGGL